MWVVKKILVGFLAIACLGAVVEAQIMSRPAGVRRSDGEWTLVPVVSHSSSGWNAPGVLALRSKSGAVGDNIVAIWYEHPLAPGGAWTAYSWTSQNQWVAINYAKQRFNIGGAYDFMWPTTDLMTDVGAVEGPAEYFKGLFVEDPLAAVVETPQREEMVQLLTQIGYQAAAVGIELDGACSADAALAKLAETAVLGASTGMSSQELENHYATGLPGCVDRGAELLPPGMIPGTLIPLPGTPIDPAHPWRRDSRPATFRPGCSTSAECCYSAPIIFIYVRDGLFGLEYLEFCESITTWTCPRAPDGNCDSLPACGPPEIGPDAAVMTCGLRYY